MMTKRQSRSNYKRRVGATGSDRYAQFSNGEQRSSESIAGKQITHPFGRKS